MGHDVVGDVGSAGVSLEWCLQPPQKKLVERVLKFVEDILAELGRVLEETTKKGAKETHY